MSTPLVSIIITNHNYGQFLTEAVRSAQEQTCNALEVIVVDDCSTDDSRNILPSLKPDKLLLLNHNVGTTVASNLGVALAQGQYCCLLNADDSLHPQYVEKCVQALEKDSCVAFAYTDFYHWGLGPGQPNNVITFPDYNFQQLCEWNFVLASALFRKEAFSAVGGFKVEEGFEDYDLWLSMVEAGWTGVHVPEVLYYYRSHDHNRSKNIDYATVGKNIKRKHMIPVLDDLKALWERWNKEVQEPLWGVSWETVRQCYWYWVKQQRVQLLDHGGTFMTVAMAHYLQQHQTAESWTLYDDTLSPDQVSAFLKGAGLTVPSWSKEPQAVPHYFDFVFYKYSVMWEQRFTLLPHALLCTEENIRKPLIVVDDCNQTDFMHQVGNLILRNGLNAISLQDSKDKHGRWAAVLTSTPLP